MDNLKKTLRRSAVLWLLSLSALALCVCTKPPEPCDDPETCCGGKAYDPSAQKCVNGAIEEKIYAVTLDANGGTVSPASAATNGNGKLTMTDLPAPAKNGYTFDGWYTAPSGGTKITANYLFSENTTIYAHWTIAPASPTGVYTVTFNANGGTVSPASATTNANGKITVIGLPTPAKNGYTFDGWYTALSGGDMITPDYTFSANTVVYARWTDVPQFAVTLNANGGTVSPASVSVNINGKFIGIRLPTPERSGYTFDGWYTASSGGDMVTSDYTFSANTVIIYAHWTVIDPDTLNYGGKKYKFVTIGGKSWMAKNFNHKPSTGNSWCVSDNEANCEKYGRLYDWNTAMSVCPNGWKLPDTADWNRLEAAVGKETAGKKLKSKSGWPDTYNNEFKGTDDFGFSALPGGYRSSVDGFRMVGYYGFWWTATENSDNNYFIYNRSMKYDDNYVSETKLEKTYGFSVRCIRD